MGSATAGESAEPTAASNDEPERVHDEPGRGEPASSQAAIEDQIRAVLGEITAAEDRQKELKAQVKAAYDQHISGLWKEGRGLDRTILAKSYDLGVKLKAFKEKVGHGNFKKEVKATFDKTSRWAEIYMELAEWRDRIESYAKQVGGDSLLQVQTIRGVRRLLTEVKDVDGFVKKVEDTAANLTEERQRDIDAGEDPDEPVNADAPKPLDGKGEPRTGEDPAFVQRAVVRMGVHAQEYAGSMTKAQRRAFYVTVTAEWLPQCDPDTVARCLLKAWQPVEVEQLIVELAPGVEAQDPGSCDREPGGLGLALCQAWELEKVETLRDFLDVWIGNKRATLAPPEVTGSAPVDQPQTQTLQ
jgi:hypothetical protein